MAANHIFGLGDVVATTATVVAILAISAMPLYAQQPSTVQLNADAQNLFKIISSDKRKIQIFCKIADLGNQLDQADQVHDTKKVEEVSRKLDEWRENCRNLPRWLAVWRTWIRIPKTLRRSVR